MHDPTQSKGIPLFSHEGIKTLLKDGRHVASEQLLLNYSYERLPCRCVQVLLPSLILHCQTFLHTMEGVVSSLLWCRQGVPVDGFAG